MRVEEGPLPGLKLFYPKVWGDARGSFYEIFRSNEFQKWGIPPLPQDNVAQSSRGILRGLHFQRPPCAQGKLVAVLHGCVLDVAVDIRVGSPTYGKHAVLELDAQHPTLLWVPAGFAHGYEVLSERALFFYKVSSYYSPDHEHGLPWNDPQLAIPWQSPAPILSGRDQHWPAFQQFQSPFTYPS